MKAVFCLGFMFLMQISRLRFKLSGIFVHPTYLCSGPFFKLFGDFKVYLEVNSFSQRISKI